MSFANPKGIASFSPRLARQRLPWVRVWNRKQRQRRCGPQPNVAATPLRWVTKQTNRTTSTMLWPFVREWESPQPRCGWDGWWTMTQGSALRATLGLWDRIPLGFFKRAVQESFVSKFGNSKFRRSLRSIRYVSEFFAASIFAESSLRHQPQRPTGLRPKAQGWRARA